MRSTDEPAPIEWAVAATVAAALVFVGLGHPIQDDNEGLYARVAAEMLESGSWIVPHLDGVPYLEKPPLLYWLTALAFRAFGVGDFAARIPVVAGALLTVSAVFVFARRRWGGRTALLAPLVAASFPLFVAMDRILMCDLLFTGLLAWALVCLHEALEPSARRGWIRAAHAFLALAVLTKGILAIAVFALVAVAMLAAAREERRRLARVILDPAGVAIFAALAVPWHVLAWQRVPSFGWFYFVNEHVLRFLGLREPRDFYEGPWWYYLPRIAAGALPWAILLFVPSRERPDEPRIFLWTWVLVPLVFFSVSVAKANYYMVVAVPALSLLLARRLATLGTSRWGALAPAAWLALVAGGAVYAARLSGPYRWPAETVPLALAAVAIAAASIGLFFARRPTAGAIACAAFSVPTALLFSASLAANEDQGSARAAAREIERMGLRDVFVFRDFENVSSLPYYLRRPVGVIDSASNDLRYGIGLAPDPRRFPSGPQFERMALERQAAVVVADARLGELRASGLVRGLRPVERIGHLTLFAWTAPREPVQVALAASRAASAAAKKRAR